MPQSSLSRPSSPQQLRPPMSGLIVIVAILFLIAVFAFYYYVR
jgi:hypothetical protein